MLRSPLQEEVVGSKGIGKHISKRRVIQQLESGYKIIAKAKYFKNNRKKKTPFSTV